MVSFGKVLALGGVLVVGILLLSAAQYGAQSNGDGILSQVLLLATHTGPRIRSSEYLVEFADDKDAKSELVNTTDGRVALAKIESSGARQEIFTEGDPIEQGDEEDPDADELHHHGHLLSNSNSSEGTVVPDWVLRNKTRKGPKKGATDEGEIPDFPASIADYVPLNPGACKPGVARKDVEFNETVFVNDTRLWPMLPDRRLEGKTEHERCHRVMLRQLQLLKSVMVKLGLTTHWFISHGTLLGAERHGGYIPWDIDIDVVMPRHYITKLRQEWRRLFPRDMFLQTEKTESTFHMWIGKERQVRIKDRYSSYDKFSFTFFKGNKKYRQKKWHLGAHIDIIPIQRLKRQRLKLLHHYFNYSDLYPLSETCFEGVTLPAPRNISHFLTTLYGPKYMEMPTDHDVKFDYATPHPCLSTTPSPGSHYTLWWKTDHPEGQDPILTPRDDPGGQTYEDDVKKPYPPLK